MGKVCKSFLPTMIELFKSLFSDNSVRKMFTTRKELWFNVQIAIFFCYGQLTHLCLACVQTLCPDGYSEDF